MKKLLKKILKPLCEKLERLFFPVVYINIADLLLPVGNTITGSQYIIASRILDIENYRHNDDTFYWQERLHECGADHAPLTPEEQTAWKNNFMRLISNFSCRGWDPNISQVSVTRKPLTVNNGTHRLAMAFCQNPASYIPVQFTVRQLWFPLDGVSYWQQKGMTVPETEIIIHRYETLIKEIRNEITGFIISKYLTREIREKLKEYGEFHIRKTVDAEDIIDAGINAYRFFSGKVKAASSISRNLTVFTLAVKSLNLEYRRYRLFSPVIERLHKEMVDITGEKKYGYIASSVTEAIALESFFDETGKKQLQLLKGGRQNQE